MVWIRRLAMAVFPGYGAKSGVKSRWRSEVRFVHRAAAADPERPHALVQGRRPLPRYIGHPTPVRKRADVMPYRRMQRSARTAAGWSAARTKCQGHTSTSTSRMCGAANCRYAADPQWRGCRRATTTSRIAVVPRLPQRPCNAACRLGARHTARTWHTLCGLATLAVFRGN